MVSRTEAVFRLEATGDNVQFQWQKDCCDIDDCGTRYRGSHKNTLQILEVKKGDIGRYRCCVNNVLVSEEAILIVGELLMNVVGY